MEFVEAVEQEMIEKLEVPAENVRFEKGNEEGKRDRILVETLYENGLKGIIGIEAAGLFLLYKRGTSMEDLVEEIRKDRERKCGSQTVGVLKNMDDYELIKGQLIVRAVSYLRNPEQIEHAIYRQVGDIALVVYLVLQEDEYDFLSAKVQKKVIESWKKSEEEIFENAMANTHALYPPRIYDWFREDGQFAYHEGTFVDPLEEISLDKGVKGNCLTNAKQLNGATALFYPGVAKRLGNLLGEDFYVAFTSIHEAMLHCVSSINVRVIEESLQSVNGNNEAEEILSQRVYYYSREADSLTVMEG